MVRLSAWGCNLLVDLKFDTTSYQAEEISNPNHVT